MATLAIGAFMDSTSNARPLHPFFACKKHSNGYEYDQHETASSSQIRRGTVAQEAREQSPAAETTGPLRSPKDNGDDQLASRANEGQSCAQLTSETTFTTLESDINVDRRKRRKISLSSKSMDNAVGLGEHQKADTGDTAVVGIKEISSAESQTNQSTIAPAPPIQSKYASSVDDTRNDEVDQVPFMVPDRETTAIAQQTMPTSDFNHSMQSKGSRPNAKNQLRLDNYGKLSTLHSEVPKEMPSELQRPQPVVEEAGPTSNDSSKLIRLTYGQGTESRQQIGQNIHTILSENGRKEAKASDQSQVYDSKPLHPFFRGHNVVRIPYGVDNDSRTRLGQRINDMLARMKKEDIEESTPRTKEAPRRQLHPFFAGGLNRRPDGASLNVVEVAHTAPSSANASGDQEGSESGEHSQPVKKLYSEPVLRRPLRKFVPLMELPWPSRGATHVRGLDSEPPFESNLATSRSRRAPRKLKNAVVEIDLNENIINRLAEGARKDMRFQSNIKSCRLPRRLVMSGRELQDEVREELSDPTSTALSQRQNSSPVHAALPSLYGEIERSLSAFDQFGWDSVPWTTKYAPKSAGEVLQFGNEAVVLRDWIRGLVVQSTRMSSGVGSSEEASGAKKPKKRKKKAAELENFIVSSDEEESDMDELAEPQEIADRDTLNFLPNTSLVRTPHQVKTSASEIRRKATNAVVLSGPHGSGKTATVYAVANELDFQVFEINSSSRRSGKDILDRVGDMTRNHLVQRHSKTDEETESSDELLVVRDKLKEEIESGRQGSVDTFFKAQTKKSKPQPTSPSSSQPASQTKTKRKLQRLSQQKQQKQSLILIEEADVLFEEDKQFWFTVLGLISQSRRPVILTCTDESLLPMNDLPFYAILRLQPAPETLTDDYLLLLAANEGHLLEREAVSSIYRGTRYDLRASITELNFWCQMAIGDEKKGLGWLLPRWRPGSDLNEKGEVLRVVSEGTYQKGLDASSQDAEQTSLHELNEADLSLHIWHSERFDIQDWVLEEGLPLWREDVSGILLESEQDHLALLTAYDTAAESMSDQDCFAGSSLVDSESVRMGYAVLLFRLTEQIPLDATIPPMREKRRDDYMSGYELLEAEPVIEYGAMSAQLGICMKMLSRQTLQSRTKELLGRESRYLQSLSRDKLNEAIVRHRSGGLTRYALYRSDFSVAFDSISEAPATAISGQGSTGGSQLSSFDRPLSLVATDLAPYVRQIVAYDLLLEDRRRKLSNLLSEGGSDPSSAKRMRMTRASRSAVEGSSRATVRRDRWFDGCYLNPALVLRTGGDWPQEVAGHEENESEASCAW